jgi:prostaglandin-H2 D-isomerase / glutathione transferase
MMKLTYFNLRGRAEVIRFIFVAAGVDYTDDRFSFDELAARKQSGELNANFGRAPVLSFDGQSFGQSKALERFLAKKYALFGKNEIEGLHIDIIGEHVRDVKDAYAAVRLDKTGDALQAAKDSFVRDKLPDWFRKIDSQLDGGAGYAVGSSFSLADLYLFQLAFDYFDAKEEVAAIAATCPKLKAAAEAARETLKNYLAIRPVTPF